jgi:hypothetical protein
MAVNSNNGTRDHKNLSEGRVKYFGLAVTIFATFSANLQAAGIIACYDGINGDPTVLRGTACASQPSFSTMAPTDFLDWSALGGALNNTYDPTANAGAPWQAVTNGGITVGLNVGPGFTGNPTLERVDNGFLYNPSGTWVPIPITLASMFPGHFNSLPNPDAGTPYGDNLVGFAAAQGPLLIQFSLPVNSVGFFISSKNDFGVDATIKAYNVLNPTTSDIPMLSYRVTDTAGGGANCAGLSLKPPVPCNDAPFLAIDAMSSQFMSIVISTTDTNGFYIDGLSLGAMEEVPEPASGLLIGGGLVLIGIVSRKLRTRV